MTTSSTGAVLLADLLVMTPALFAAIVVVATGALIFWSNPGRIVNRVVFSCSIHNALWLVCLHLTKVMPEGSKEGFFLYRTACAIGASVPLHFLVVLKEGIATGLKLPFLQLFRQYFIWIVLTVALTVIPFTDFFIPADSPQWLRLRGWGFFTYMFLDMGLYAFLLRDAFITTRKLTGSKRMEMQVWMVGGCAMTLLILALMTLNMWFPRQRYWIHVVQPMVLLMFYAGTAIAITTKQIFDARQVILITIEKTILVAASTGVAFLLSLFLTFLPETVDLLATTALTLGFAMILSRWLDLRFKFYPQATAARQAAYAAARSEVKDEDIDRAFVSIFKGWGQTDHAIVMSTLKGPLQGGGITIPNDCPVANTLRELRWATPERLAREKQSPDRDALAQFLIENRLGVAVSGEGTTLTVLVGVGVPASRLPFTYPQVVQLMELTSILESAMERAHFSMKAQHAEQLATVGLLGAGLAHEIRNPLVTIKTFVQLLPHHHQDPAFRQKFFTLIGDEVTRIDRLTEQLLDMAAPKAYAGVPVHIHELLATGLELVSAKASDRNIRIITDFKASPDVVLTDSSAAKQVLLNLSFNAIHAVEGREGDKWIRVQTSNCAEGLEMAISDNGPGISPEILPRLFEPFQTTKSSGFGLGLAICSDILSGLKATIAVDPPAPGEGATFRVHFPCPPPLS